MINSSDDYEAVETLAATIGAVLKLPQVFSAQTSIFHKSVKRTNTHGSPMLGH